MSSVAVVFGVSGISGFGMANALLRPKYKSTIKRVIALSKHPLTLEESGLPDDPRLTLSAGVDLLQSVEDVAAALRSQVPGIEEATDVFYTGGQPRRGPYGRPLIELGAFNTSNTDNQLVMKDDNTRMLSTAVGAMEQVAPNLSFIALQTGSNVSKVIIAQAVSSAAGAYFVIALRHSFCGRAWTRFWPCTPEGRSASSATPVERLTDVLLNGG